MKISLLTLFLAGVASGCVAQTNRIDSLNVSFAPSFIYPCKLTIKPGPASATLVYNKDVGEAALVSSDQIKALTQFLATYKFRFTDTVGLPPRKFKYQDYGTVGLDGISIFIELHQGNLVKKEVFWSPDRGIANDNLMQVFLHLMNASFKDKKTVNYIEQLEQYFPHQLGIKKLSDNPLKYRLYGAVPSEDSTRLHLFFKSLPHNRDSFIDMSNFLGMDTILYPLIKQYCDKNKRIYWVNPNTHALVILNKTGIPNENIKQ